MRPQSLLDKLLSHGLCVTPDTLQGLPVLLLALVPANTVQPHQATTPEPTKAHTPAPAAGATPGARRPGQFAGLAARQPCHLKRPPHRPMRS